MVLTISGQIWHILQVLSPVFWPNFSVGNYILTPCLLPIVCFLWIQCSLVQVVNASVAFYKKSLFFWLKDFEIPSFVKNPIALFIFIGKKELRFGFFCKKYL